MPDPLNKYTTVRRREVSRAMWAQRTLEQRGALGKKIGNAHRGRKLSLDHRQKLSLAHRGQTAWNKGKCETRPEVLLKLRSSHLGKIQSKKTRQLRAVASKKTWTDPVIRQKRTAGLRKYWENLQARVSQKRRMRKLAQNPNWGGHRGHPHSRVARKKISASLRERWKNPQSRLRLLRGVRAMMKSASKTPNGIERRVWVFLDKLQPGMWIYTGGGPSAKRIGGYYPDFTCYSRHRIIEIDGVLWHQNRQRDQERNRAYRKAGYKVLALRYTGSNESTVMRKLENFCE